MDKKILLLLGAVAGGLALMAMSRKSPMDCQTFVNRWCASQGSRRGDANYDAEVDVNGDGVVNIQDFSRFVHEHNCPPSIHVPCA